MLAGLEEAIGVFLVLPGNKSDVLGMQEYAVWTSPCEITVGKGMETEGVASRLSRLRAELFRKLLED